MIAFVSLFFQLVTGIHPVELATSGPVAAVELRLDGQTVGTVRGEPWTVECDFGSELAPHRLLAVGLDGDGREVARTEQWVNLPLPRSQAELVPEAGEPTRSVRLLWRSVDGDRPEAVAVTFDGQPLELVDPQRVELPPYDPSAVHLLRAELDFGPSLARAELLVGDPAGEEIGSELTAIPVLTAGRGKPPAAGEMAGWFHQGGRPLRVVAVERGPSDLVMVLDPSPRLQGRLEGLRRQALEPVRSARPRPTGLKHLDRLRVIVPVPAVPAVEAPAAGSLVLFPISADLAAQRRAPTTTGASRQRVAGPRAEGLLAALPYPAATSGAPLQLADAVAEAGRAAAAGRRARAVILVTAGDTADASRLDPATARAYLQRLQVPLVVWSPQVPKAWRRGDPWGTVEEIGGRSTLFRAVRDVRSLLDRQLVVWLEGRHLPQEIELAPEAAGRLELAGGSVPRPAPPEPALTTAIAGAPNDEEDPESGDGPPAPPPSAAVPPVTAAPSAAVASPVDLRFAETVEVEVVNVEVMVSDRRGGRVLDLERDDFEVYEDGRRQEITHFAAPAAGVPAAGDPAAGDPGVGAPSGGEAPAELPTAGADEPHHLVVFVDTRSLRMADRRPLAEALRQELAGGPDPGGPDPAGGSPPRTMLVAFDGAVAIRQGFTRDRQRLLASLAEIEKEIGSRPQAVKPGDQRLADEMAEVNEEFIAARTDPLMLDVARAHLDAVLAELRFHGEELRREILATVEVLQGFAASLGAVEGRKSLLYVGDHLTLAPARGLYAMIERYADKGDVELEERQRASLGFEENALHTGRDFEALVREANGNGVTFYTLTPPSRFHPGGVGSARAGIPGVQLVLRDERSAGVREAVCLLSNDTGGLCQVEGSEPRQLVEQAVADFTTAYSLAYTPERPADGELHTIEVKVRRPGLRLRHREGYLAKPRQDRLRDRLIAALLFAADADGLGVEVRLSTPEAVDEDRYVLPLEVRVPVARLGLLPAVEAGVSQAQLRLLLAVAGDAGRTTEVQEFPLVFQASSEQLVAVPPAVYVHRLRLTVERGGRRVAVGLWDEIGRAGSFVSRPLPAIEDR